MSFKTPTTNKLFTVDLTPNFALNLFVFFFFFKIIGLHVKVNNRMKDFTTVVH